MKSSVNTVDPTFVTQAELARIRGVTDGYITKKVRDGTLQPLGNGTLRREEAVSALENTQQNIRVDNKHSPAVAGLTLAKTTTEQYRAKIAKLDFEKKQGKLRDSDEVDGAIEIGCEAITRAIDMLPSHADDLYSIAQSGDVAEMRTMLKKMARDMRELVSIHLRKALETPDESGTP